MLMPGQIAGELGSNSLGLRPFAQPVGRLFATNSSSLRCRLLVTGRTLPGCGWTEFLVGFHNLIMASGAVAMKGLLIVQGNQLSSDFELDLRDFRQELRFGVRSSMTIATATYFRRSCLFFEKLRGESRRPIRRPGSFQRGMLGSFRSRLRGVMTFNARDLGALNAAILRCMIEVAELHRPQLCLWPENDSVLGFAAILCRSLRAECAENQQD